MVERVEVLTGGASAAYGSDAIGGVVNFIMKKDFEGVQFDAMYGLYQHNNDFGGPGAVKLRDMINGRTGRILRSSTARRQRDRRRGHEFNVMMGVSTEDGRGNITAYAGVRDNEQVLQRDRDYSACSLNANPTRVLRLRRLGDELPGAISPTPAAGRASSPIDQTDRATRSGRSTQPPTCTTSVRRITTSGLTRATRWARWVTTSSPRPRTSTPS